MPDLFSRGLPGPTAAPPAAKPAEPVQVVDPIAGHPLQCVCGDWAGFGFGVDLRHGVVGVWRCQRCAIAEGRS